MKKEVRIMPYIMSCGANKYFGSDNANRLAVVRAPGSALRFTTPMEGRGGYCKESK